MSYLRSQVANIANINIETLRYYERNGLIFPPVRGENRYRLYDDDTIEKLQIIKFSIFCSLIAKHGYSIKELNLPLSEYWITAVAALVIHGV